MARRPGRPDVGGRRRGRAPRRISTAWPPGGRRPVTSLRRSSPTRARDRHATHRPPGRPGVPERKTTSDDERRLVGRALSDGAPRGLSGEFCRSSARPSRPASLREGASYRHVAVARAWPTARPPGPTGSFVEIGADVTARPTPRQPRDRPPGRCRHPLDNAVKFAPEGGRRRSRCCRRAPRRADVIGPRGSGSGPRSSARSSNGSTGRAASRPSPATALDSDREGRRGAQRRQGVVRQSPAGTTFRVTLPLV